MSSLTSEELKIARRPVASWTFYMHLTFPIPGKHDSKALHNWCFATASFTDQYHSLDIQVGRNVSEDVINKPLSKGSNSIRALGNNLG